MKIKVFGGLPAGEGQPTPSKKAGDWRRLKWRGRHFASPEARPTNAYTEFFVRFGVRDGALMVEQATHNDGLSYEISANSHESTACGATVWADTRLPGRTTSSESLTEPSSHCNRTFRASRAAGSAGWARGITTASIAPEHRYNDKTSQKPIAPVQRSRFDREIPSRTSTASARGASFARNV